ncbi:unnamed protein product [Cladocopium goreaui]|uniref:Uncharacterized protein n=1 Tax=Cladocopium goreaui TaxID=2562237 RepID=A0A9P1FJN7_9DINO|nr:unnamed protein product [Cladocopium goreaui]
MFRIVQPWKHWHCRGQSAIREARSWVIRPPGASKAPWVPADLTADDAPAQALRRAHVQGRTLPKKAYVVPRLDRATWRWTDVRGDKIYYRQWSYSSRPTEAWLEGGMPKSMNRDDGLTTLEAQRWRRCTSTNRDSDGLSLEDLRSLAAKATSRADQKAAGVHSMTESWSYMKDKQAKLGEIGPWSHGIQMVSGWYRERPVMAPPTLVLSLRGQSAVET